MHKEKQISLIFTSTVKNNRLLYSTLFLISITLLARWWVEEQFASVVRNEKYIEKAVEQEVESQEFSMIPVLDSLALFGKVVIQKEPQTPYPFFIYQQGKLINWSDNTFVPAYKDLKRDARYFYIDKPYGKFIIRKWLVSYKNVKFEVFSFITLYRKYPINNLYIQSSINSKIGQNGRMRIDNLESNAKSYKLQLRGNALFKIKLEKDYKPAIVKPIIFIDYVLLILQLLLYYAFYRLIIRHKKGLEVVVIIGGWAYFKLVLPIMEGITVFASVNLFDPQYYAVSWFERSMADLLINTLFILLISMRVGVWAKNKNFLKLFSKHDKNFLSVALLILVTLSSFWIINYPFFQLRSIYDNSQISIDISKSLQFNWTRSITFVIVVVINLSTFLLYHTIIRHLLKYVSNTKMMLLLIITSVLINLPLSYVANMPFANLAFVNVVIVLLLWGFNFTQSLASSTYKRFLYIVLFIGVLSGINGWVISEFEMQQKIEETANSLEKKLASSDQFAEFLLSAALTDLSKDQFIKSRFSSPFLAKKPVISKIKLVFLNSYLSKYEQTIRLYNAKGHPFEIEKDTFSIFQKLAFFKGVRNETEYPSVFRVKDQDHYFSKHYLGYVPIKRKNSLNGYVLVELVEKQFTTSLSYPSLLVDNKFESSFSNEISYALYLNGEMINTVGAVEFPKKIAHQSAEIWFKNGLVYVSKSDKNRAIIASAPFDKAQIILSNFSFIFLITLLPVLLGWFIIPFLKNGKLSAVSYTERIIWYLNLAFIIPLIIVTVVTFRLLSNSFESESNFTKTSLVERISHQLSGSLAHYLEDNTTYEQYIERLEILSDNSELTINVFGLDGELISSSQPSVFSKKVLAPYINQYALTSIKNKGRNQLVLQENIDNLSFSNSYVAVKSEEKGKMLGIISVPFFSTNTSLNSSKREAFNTILNVFAIVLVLTMLATYFAGKWLTKPLKLIGDKLKSTSFLAHTAPINIQWTDELGMLIKGYNQMLAKLEQSKDALKQSEKEKAWREAAQQVAHEIKNPLTPMKLTLQRIANKISSKKIKAEELESPLLSVLDQVETLNRIASSFSEFAKMPTPVINRVEINTVILKTAALFSSDKELKIKLQLANQHVYSMVDSNLLSRMLNNLLINAKQSIQKKQAFVEVEIATIISDVLTIRIKDNGEGIAPEIADKVFIPKFTTKEQGSGIGLAMTKYGVENMQGKIYFSSEPKVGTIFNIEFPIIK